MGLDMPHSGSVLLKITNLLQRRLKAVHQELKSTARILDPVCAAFRAHFAESNIKI